MANSRNLYPCGEILTLNYEECMEKGLIGFYDCVFNQDHLRYKIISVKTAIN